MTNNFSIFDSPFSDETKKLRINSLLSSGVCLFIGLTGEIPDKFSLLGMSFTSKQQNILGWFLITVTIYLFLHFISMASIEIAKWIKPFYHEALRKKKLLGHPAFDEADFRDSLGPPDYYNLDYVRNEADLEAKWETEKRLRYLFNFVYLRLIIEIIIPLVIGCWGIISLSGVVLKL